MRKIVNNSEVEINRNKDLKKNDKQDEKIIPFILSKWLNYYK